MNTTLLDVSLPEKNVDNILAILKANNMNDARVPDQERYSFNCWGFVAFYYGWETKAKWLPHYVMEMHLEENTTPIQKSEIQAGDIAVFHRYDRLTHTALMTTDRSVVCHKPGSTPLCIDTLKAAANSYGDVSFVRPVSVGVEA